MKNSDVIANYAKLKLSIFFVPLFLILALVLFLYSQNALSAVNYVEIQRHIFFYINHFLGQYPNFIFNITQLGDASILLSFLIILILYTPKMWEALLSASLISLVFSSVLKNLFSIPRPAAIFDNSSFIIIGKTVSGNTSLPSGHSITIFTTLTVLLFAFMPVKWILKIIWILAILLLGLIIAFARVGVGAHYPLDVIFGSIVGSISGLMGIFICQKYKFWNWINSKKYYPVFILLITVCGISFVNKIIIENLIIYFLALFISIISLYKITYVYLKK